MRRPVPLEHDEQRRLVSLLRAAGLVVVASLNGVRLTYSQRRKAVEAGMLAGEPDLRIDGHPLRPSSARLVEAAAAVYEVAPDVARWLEAGAPSCVYIEMKRQRGGRVEPHQAARHEAIRALGDVVIVARGWRDALEQLQAEGVVE